MWDGLHLRAELGHEKLEEPCPGSQSHSRGASFLCSRRPRPLSLRRGWVTRTLFRDTGWWAVVTLWQHFGHYVSIPPGSVSQNVECSMVGEQRSGSAELHARLTFLVTQRIQGCHRPQPLMCGQFSVCSGCRTKCHRLGGLNNRQ